MCTLKCPRCSRTEFIEKFPQKWTNKNLNLEHLKSFLDIDLNGISVGLIGNDGDPIYYPDILELVKFLKSKGAIIKLHTNGSYRTIEWWEQFNKLLSSEDIISFSIDGVPSNFTKYRINADWDSIKAGIKVLAKGPAKVVWKYILFSYNEDTVDEAEKLSIELGMDDFVLVNSDRWIKNDWLKPSMYVDIPVPESGMLYIGAHNGDKSESKYAWNTKSDQLKIDPMCKKTNNLHFISADGFYVPCCWIGDYRFYYKTEFYKNRDLYDISKTTLMSVLTEPKMINFYNTIEEEKPKYCTFNCGKL
jgi:organic radical activating enzyme